tara:strand:+ start:818 stop:1183 length:366 start_codon:yes stop_codon:yes gene_type:complete
MSEQIEVNSPADDRILHMSDAAAAAIPLIRLWARSKGIEVRLDKALEYLRTFTKGPEKDWMSHLHTDMFFETQRPSFTCAVSKRGEKIPDARDYALREGLTPYMTIGMMWSEHDQDWSFHS